MLRGNVSASETCSVDAVRFTSELVPVHVAVLCFPVVISLVVIPVEICWGVVICSVVVLTVIVPYGNIDTC